MDTVDSDPEGVVFGGTTIGPHPSVSAQSTDGALRFCWARSGGAPGHPHISGNSRHTNVIHCPAYGPFSKHSEPMGRFSRCSVHVVAPVRVLAEREVGGGSTTIGPQSSPSGHGNASLIVWESRESMLCGGYTTIGPQSSPSGHGNASLGWRGSPGTASRGSLRTAAGLNAGIGSTGNGPQSSPSGHGRTIFSERESAGTTGVGRGLAKTAR